MAGRAPATIGAFAAALGDPDGDPTAAGARVAKLAARSGHTRLSTLGVEEAHLVEVVAVAEEHPLLANTPEPPNAEELSRLLHEAL